LNPHGGGNFPAAFSLFLNNEDAKAQSFILLVGTPRCSVRPVAPAVQPYLLLCVFVTWLFSFPGNVVAHERNAR
jgi:hypothetical protein